ncbi:MAG: hypothetical protein ACLUHL_13415, partial [Dysosmobacter welbionis]
MLALHGFRSLFDLQLFRHVIQIDGQDLAHALLLHGGVVASSASLVPASRPELTLSAAPPFPTETASLGFGGSPGAASPCSLDLQLFRHVIQIDGQDLA